jgi:hypothetical protein
MIIFFNFFWLGFYVAPTWYRSYGIFPALLVEEDLRGPSVHYFRHKWHLSRTTDVPLASWIDFSHVESDALI